jgi:ketosteroid isomerase-like protein
MPMETAQTRAVVSAMYDAAITGDFTAVMAILSPDVVVHEPSFLEIAGTAHGLEAFSGVMRWLAERLDFSAMEVARMVVDGERAVSVLHILDRSTGKPVVIAEESKVESGRVTEISIYYHDGQSVF